MGILDGIVEWIAEQVMNILDLITTSVLGALGCSMDTFLRYFPAAETMYDVFLALALGLILLNWVWQLFKNYFMGAGIEAEDPLKLSIRSFIFIFLAFYAEDIVNLLLGIAGTPYDWILTEELPSLDFASFNSVITVILGVCANGAVAIIALILVLILAWNYIKLLFEAAEREAIPCRHRKADTIPVSPEAPARSLIRNTPLSAASRRSGTSCRKPDAPGRRTWTGSSWPSRAIITVPLTSTGPWNGMAVIQRKTPLPTRT